MKHSICLAAIIASLFSGLTISQASAVNVRPGANTSKFTHQEVVDAVDHTRKQITAKKAEFMLSFDDGPLPGATERVLDALAALRAIDGKPVRVGFFLLADAPDDFWRRRFYYPPYEVWTNKGSIAKYPEITQLIKQSGHIVGNHTAHHAWFRWPWLDTPEAVLSEFTEWEAVTKPVLGPLNPRLFRPPYMIVTETVRETARKLGYQIVMGEAVGDTIPGMEVEDIKDMTKSILAEWSQPYPCILIFHDIIPATYEHLYEIVGNLQQQGFHLVHFDPERL
jgi:peptidoglycan/xylan/chitin deacetylase (PgdA/CDA1 family)